MVKKNFWFFLLFTFSFVVNASAEKFKDEKLLACAADAAKEFGVDKDEVLSLIKVETGMENKPVEITNNRLLSNTEWHGIDLESKPTEITSNTFTSNAKWHGIDFKKIIADRCLSYRLAAWHLSELKNAQK